MGVARLHGRVMKSGTAFGEGLWGCGSGGERAADGGCRGGMEGRGLDGREGNRGKGWG